MSLDPKKVPIQFDFIDDPQGRAEVLGSVQQVSQAVTTLGRNDGALLQAENFLRMEQAAKRAGTATKSAASAGGSSVSGRLGAVGAGVGQAASIAGVSGQAGSAIGLLGSNIGTLGATGAVVAVGMVALGVAMKELQKVSEELRREEELILEARFAEIDATGQTTEAILKQIEQTSDAAEKARQKEAFALEEEARLRDEQRSGILGGLKDIGDSVGIWSDGVNEAEEAAEKWGDTAEDTAAKVEGLNDALDNTETAAADAAEALEEAAEAQTEAILDQVDAIGKERKARQEAAKRTRSENKDRLKAIQDQRSIIKAQIAALKASGLATDEVVAKLGALEKEMKGLANEAKIVSEAVKKGTQADREAAIERKKIRDEERREARESRREAARERRQARLEAQHEQLKEIIDFSNEIKKIEFNASKQRHQIQVDANRDQERLLREAARAFENDFYQDFLGAFTQQNDLAFRLQETKIAAGQALTDVNTSSFLNQQETRADAGAQQLLGPAGGPNITFNVGQDLNAVTQHLQSIGVVPNYG